MPFAYAIHACVLSTGPAGPQQLFAECGTRTVNTNAGVRCGKVVLKGKIL